MGFFIENGVLEKYWKEPEDLITGITEVTVPNDVRIIAEKTFLY